MTTPINFTNEVNPPPIKTLPPSTSFTSEIRTSLFSPKSKPSRVILLYYCPEMYQLAKSIAQLSNGRVELCQIDWNTFPDGYPNLFIHRATELKWYHVCFLACLHSPNVFFTQFSVCTAIPKLLPKSFKLLLPFFPTGTMERISREGEVATANTLARVLSTLPQCARGPCQIAIYDIHALQNRFYFRDTVLIRLGTCVPLLIQRLAQLKKEKGDDVVIAFPDDGAHKRFAHMFVKYECAICHKVREEGEKRVVKLKEGHVKDRHVVIVDDLVQSGSTLIECALELKRNGASWCSAYVTHAIFPNNAWQKFTEQKYSNLFEFFWLTDSNPTVSEKLQNKRPFEVLSMAPILMEVILDEIASV